MSVHLTCANCRQELQIPPEYEGKAVRCPVCKTEVVPGAPSKAPTPPPEVEQRRFSLDDDTWPTPHVGDSPVEPAPRTGRRWLLGIGALALVVFGTYYAVDANRPPPGLPFPPRRAPFPVAGPGIMGKAPIDLARKHPGLFERQPQLDQGLVRDLDNFFDGPLTMAVRAAQEGNDNSFQALADSVRMGAILAELQILPDDLDDHALLLNHARKRFAKELAVQTAKMRWGTFEIRHVQVLQNNEVAVVVRHVGAGERSRTMRWWLSGGDGMRWQVFDFESDDGPRLAVATLASAAANAGEKFDKLARLANLGEALHSMVQRGDADQAERTLREIDDLKLPPRLEADRLLTRGRIHFDRKEYERALAAFHAIRKDRMQPDLLGLDLLCGMAQNRLQRWVDAQRDLDSHRRLLGDDALVYRELGLTSLGLNDVKEAHQHFCKALDLDPFGREAFVGLVRTVRTPSDRQEVARRFQCLSDMPHAFDDCAEDCRKAGDGQTLALLVSEMRRLQRHHDKLDVMSAFAKIFNGDPDQALPEFQAALRVEPAAKVRDEYRRDFARHMARAGRSLALYRAFPDGESFRVLVMFLDNDLDDLVALHAKKQPDDPILPFCRGHIHVREGRFAEADKEFAAGLAKPPDQTMLTLFAMDRVVAGLHLGKALAVYREVGPDNVNLDDLVELCFKQRKLDVAQALLDKGAERLLDKESLAMYRIRLKLEQGKANEAWAIQKQTFPRDRGFAEVAADAVATGNSLEAYQAAPDQRLAFRNLAKALLHEGTRQDLRRLMDVHRQKHEDDPWLAVYQAQVHVGDGAWQEAAKVLDALRREADTVLLERYESNYALVMAKAGRSNDAYARFPQPDIFEQLAHVLYEDKKAVELESLLDRHERRFGTDRTLRSWRIRARLAANQPDEALELLRLELENEALVPPLATLLPAFEEVARGLDVYRLATDNDEVFALLARELVATKKPDTLARLLQVHRRANLESDLHLRFRAELHLLRNNALLAHQVAENLSKQPDADRADLEDLKLRIAVRFGVTADTWRARGGSGQMFLKLAGYCLSQRNADQLAALIAARRQTGIEVPVIWDVEVHHLKKDAEKCVALLEKHRTELAGSRVHQDKFANYLVRNLVQCKRYDDAQRETANVAPTRLRNVLRVLVPAAQGDVKQSIAAIETVQGQRRQLLDACYDDADLGPILRSPGFQEFRRTFGEPSPVRGRVGP